jgi:hypothetical protein
MNISRDQALAVFHQRYPRRGPSTGVEISDTLAAMFRIARQTAGGCCSRSMSF